MREWSCKKILQREISGRFLTVKTLTMLASNRRHSFVHFNSTYIWWAVCRSEGYQRREYARHHLMVFEILELCWANMQNLWREFYWYFVFVQVTVNVAKRFYAGGQWFLKPFGYFDTWKTRCPRTGLNMVPRMTGGWRAGGPRSTFQVLMPSPNLLKSQVPNLLKFLPENDNGLGC